MKKNTDPRTILLVSAVCLLLAMVFTAGYFTLRKTFARFSLDFLHPFLKSAKVIANTTEAATLAAKESKTSLAALVIKLTRENARLAALNETANALERDNENLRTLLRIEPQGGFTPTYAEIIVRDPIKWSETFTIDAGQSNGISEGDCVLAPYIRQDGTQAMAMIGRITLAANRSSIVATLYDSECRSGVLLESANAHGILSCGAAGRRKTVAVTFLPSENAYSTGDRVITSGASRNTPFGLLLGMTVPTQEGYSAKIDRTRLFAEAEFIPAVKIDDVRFVVVLSPNRETPDATDETE